MIEPKTALKNILPFHQEEVEDLEPRLKLDKNENVYGASKNAVSILRNFDVERFSSYPDYTKYAKKYAEIYEINIDNILFVDGIDLALNVIINAYLDKDDLFLCQSVSDDKAELYAKLAGAKIEHFDKESFEINIDNFRKSLNTDTKVCYFSAPNSISGETLRASGLIKLLEEFPNTLFVVDVSYVNWAGNIDFKDYTDTIDEFSNIIVIKSYSSDYGLANLGLTTIVSNREIIKNLKEINPNHTISELSFCCLLSAIKDSDYFEAIKEENYKARQMLYEGLLDLGFKPYLSDTNFILCDFWQYCDFYYNKLKNNGVIVRKFDSDSICATCLRITVPKVSGVKYILKLLEKKDLIIFAFEDTLIDEEKSYNVALTKTFEHFAKYEIPYSKIKEAKVLSNLNPLETIQKLLYNVDIEASLSEISRVFQDIFCNTECENEEYLIDKDKLIIEEEILQQLSLNYDMVLITDRTYDEVIYTLKKLNVNKYFSYIKTNSLQISELLEKCPYKTVELVVSNEEILSSATRAKIKATGLITGEKNNSATVNNFKHYGCNGIIFETENILNHFEINT